MAARDETVDTVLIVDDEETVRKTFQEWLESSGQKCRILTAADAEAALVLANQHTIDLAILDWNLGAGNDGLRLLEDLYLFNPDVVAIMITGFAQQATPLDAMRMGVRDYLDKNQDLNRERSEEHTSELQSRGHLVCRLLLEKKKAETKIIINEAKLLIS